MMRKTTVEVETFLKKYPEIFEFDLLLPDSNAVIRGKRIKREKLKSIYEKGMYFPASVFAMDVTGETIEETGLGIKSGDRDILCLPVPKTLKVVPWQEGRGQLLLRMFTLESEPFYGNPREVLKSVLEKFHESGFTAVVALEIEFYLNEAKRRKGQPPKIFRITGSGQEETEGQLYSLSILDLHESFLKEVSKFSTIQDIPADTALSELSPGQFEINLHHVPDAITACDHAILLKRIIRSVARNHEMEATFMAKPYENEAGSGMHAHISLLDKDGLNLFQGKDSSGSLELSYAIEGLRSTLSESMLIFASHANSYHRFNIDSYAPINSSWGYNNRTVSFRIPASNLVDTRIEHRIAGADTNPYLLVATILSGIYHGLKTKKMPPPPAKGNAYLEKDFDLPRTWEDSRKFFENAQILPEYLGTEFCSLFLNLKFGEQTRFLSKIKPLEYDWYFKTI